MSNMENEYSLVGCMREVPDPRAPYNQKHKFLDIIIIAVTAILCGMDTWNEIEDWACSKEDWLRTFLELPGGIPSHDTINRVFQMMEPAKLHDAFFRWTGAVAGKIEGVVAIDGKTIRRSRDGAKGNKPAHVVSAWASEASLVLGQLRVEERTNEIRAIPELLEILCLKGCVVTIDAMGTQKEIAEKIIDKGADYILQVKGNQETLLEDISLYFEKDIFPRKKTELEEEGRYSKGMDFDHGRQEIREYYVENDVEWLRENHPRWKGLNGIGACVSTITNQGVTTTAVSYSIYSQEGPEAKEYGKERRSHWGIDREQPALGVGHWVSGG